MKSQQLKTPGAFLLAALAGAALLAALLALATSHPATAQAPDQDWSEPVNLSRSGGTDNPILLVDPNETIHVIWQDTILGLVYTQFDGQEWSQPAGVRFPFSPQSPVLVNGPDDRIHAFWKDDANRLFTSSVRSVDVGLPSRWTSPRRLADSALDFAVTVDEPGNLHVVYLDQLDFPTSPSGIYYLRSVNNGLSWGRPTLLYASPYYRTVDPKDVNLDLDSVFDGETVSLFAGFDNRPRNRVLLSRSLDGGDTWEPAEEILNPEASIGQRQPLNLMVNMQGQSSILIWQEGQPDGSCLQYFQESPDRGKTWQAPAKFFDIVTGCPEDLVYLPREDSFDILFATLQNQVYLLAWDGERWSLPQPQQQVTNFIDPDSTASVDLGCLQAALIGGRRLVVVGCDASGNGDTWLLQRDLGQIEDWFPPPSSWNAPQVIANLPEVPSPLALAADPEGRLHVFWSWATPAQTGDPTTAVFYSNYDGDRWIQPLTIQSIPGNWPNQPAVAVDPRGRLLLAWSGGDSGEIFFSKADYRRAASPAEWSAPVPIPSPRRIGSPPDLSFGENNTIYLAFAIPINEDRGIYLTRSTDTGNTWSEPILVFDGTTAGWELVGPPRITRSGNGVLHLIWAQAPIPGGTSPDALYYARSEDDGQTWSEPDRVAEDEVGWYQVSSFGERSLHLLWQTLITGNAVVWHQFSQDSGLTWSRPTIISSLGRPDSPVAQTMDRAGRLHFFQMTTEQNNDYLLRSWVWEGEDWSASETLEVESTSPAAAVSLAAVQAPPDQLAALYMLALQPGDGGVVGNLIYFTDRRLLLPAAEATPLPTLTPTPQSTPTATPFLGPTPTPTLMFPSSDIANPPSTFLSPENRWVGAVAGGLAATLIVGIIFFIGLRTARRRREF